MLNVITALICMLVSPFVMLYYGSKHALEKAWHSLKWKLKIQKYFIQKRFKNRRK